MRNRRAGWTIVEMVLALGILSLLAVGGLGAVSAVQDVFTENQLLSRLRYRAQTAMDRIVDLTGQALTTDPLFLTLEPATGVGAHCLRFQVVNDVDATGQPVYDPLRVYIYGPDPDPWPCKGLIVGRGPYLQDILDAGGGSDGTLGTRDDDTSASLGGGIPAVELLIPDTFAPRSGDMLTVDVQPAPVGRLVVFTLRVNVRSRDGSHLLDDDLVLVERVALRQ